MHDWFKKKLCKYSGNQNQYAKYNPAVCLFEVGLLQTTTDYYRKSLVWILSKYVQSTNQARIKETEGWG